MLRKMSLPFEVEKVRDTIARSIKSGKVEMKEDLAQHSEISKRRETSEQATQSAASRTSKLGFPLKLSNTGFNVGHHHHSIQSSPFFHPYHHRSPPSVSYIITIITFFFNVSIISPHPFLHHSKHQRILLLHLPLPNDKPGGVCECVLAP